MISQKYNLDNPIIVEYTYMVVNSPNVENQEGVHANLNLASFFFIIIFDVKTRLVPSSNFDRSFKFRLTIVLGYR